MSAQAGVPTARSLHIIVFNEEQRRRLAKRHSYSLMGMPHATHTFSLTEFSHVRSFSVKQHNSSYQPPASPILSPNLAMSFDFLVRNSCSFCRTQHAHELGSLHYLVHAIASYLRTDLRPLYFLTLLISHWLACSPYMAHTAPEPGLDCTGETHKRRLQSGAKLMGGKGSIM